MLLLMLLSIYHAVSAYFPSQMTFSTLPTLDSLEDHEVSQVVPNIITAVKGIHAPDARTHNAFSTASRLHRR
jgi:hypothetical protein